jgi:hypothetical protein
LSVSEADGELRAEHRQDYKGWLTPVGDATFITLEPLSLAHFAGVADGSQLPFFVARIALVDDALQLRLVDGSEQMVKDAQNSSELEAVVRELVSSDSLYSGEGDTFRKVDDKDRIQAVLKAFPDEF